MNSDDDQINFSKLGSIKESLNEKNRELSDLKNSFVNLIAALFISFSCIGISGIILLFSSIISLPTLIGYIIVDALFIKIISNKEVKRHKNNRKKTEEIIKIINSQEEYFDSEIESENINFEEYKKNYNRDKSVLINNNDMKINRNKSFNSVLYPFCEETPFQKLKKYLMD